MHGLPDPKDPTLMYHYVPEFFRYELKAAECVKDLLAWTKQYRLWDSPDNQFRIMDFCRFEHLITGAQEGNYDRKLLTLKLLETTYILDDMAEKLIGTRNEAAQKLAVKAFRTATNTICGHPWSPIDVSEFSKDCPLEVELCREIDDAFHHAYTECHRLMSPKLLKGFQQVWQTSLQQALIEYDNWLNHLTNRTFASREEFLKVKTHSSLYHMVAWTTLDEEDMVYCALESALMNAISIITVLENDVISAPKELGIHNPYNVVLKFMSQGLSLRDASLKVMQIRNGLSRSVELIFYTMDEDYRRSIDKAMRSAISLLVYQCYSFRMGWTDTANTVELYWPKEKLHEWQAEHNIIGQSK
ncbi:hypothetical protein HDE_04563 [Halotydeus destructor]|nr:hypothetical protein HDE_04563 [Halotydeus destructor]